MFATSHNRRVVDDMHDGTVQYVLYNTPVVTLSQCRNSAVLRHGGHDTPTTKRAINDALATLGSDRRVYQFGRVWRVGYRHLVSHPSDPEFKDGMTIMLR